MPCHDEKLTLMTKFQHGFTLVEAIIVITVTGIIAAVVAVFIRAPIQGYFDSARRAELTDTADTAVRRIARDLRLALPNSVRVTGGNQAIEFLSTRDGGRYRAEPGTGSEDILDFSQNDTSFDVLGPPITFATGNQIVVYNLGVPGADAYAGNNRSQITGGSGYNIQIQSKQFPFASPASRFQIVDTPVSYICNLTAGTLTRYSGYTISPTQPNPPTGGTSALLAQNVSACSFTYQPGVTERSGLVSLQLAITLNNETVSLHHEMHVSNVP